MATLSMRGSGSVSGVSQIVTDGILSSGISCELVGRADRSFSDGTRATMLVFEKYFYRAGNRASISVMISGRDGNVSVDAVGAGGGTSVFFRFSWGAESSFVSTLEKILNNYGFSVRY